MVLVSDCGVEEDSEEKMVPGIEMILDASLDGGAKRTEYFFEYGPVNPFND